MRLTSYSPDIQYKVLPGVRGSVRRALAATPDVTARRHRAVSIWRSGAALDLAATARPTGTATALNVRGAAAQERVSRQTSDNCGNAGELENTWRASTGTYYE